MINLKINGKEVQVPEGMTVLQAAKQAGVTIPTLCNHPDLHATGGCRICVVDVKGWRTPMASCTLPASEGMEVETHSPAIDEIAQDHFGIASRQSSTRLPDMYVSGSCELQDLAYEYQVDSSRRGASKARVTLLTATPTRSCGWI